MSSPLSVGFLGLGAMGAPMALTLARAGFPVRGFDVSPRAQEQVGDALELLADPREAAAGADVVVVMVATGAQLHDVLFGERGVAEALGPDTVLLVMATVGPQAVESCAQGLESRGVRIVDAPVSGGTARAATGDLLVMVGGAEEDVAAVRPLLDAMAANAPLVGPRVGDGQRFKVVNQLLCGVHIAVAGEALALADSMGLDAAQCLEVLSTGAATSFMFEDRGPRMLQGEEAEVRSALDIFVKDMGLVTDAARAVAQPVPLASAAEQLYVRGRREGHGRHDDSSVFDVLRSR
ncbi:hydroxyacid dehydrogenase [Kocuria rosea subsp. polaris]|uniref:Hydroxyacid dehydrogenase n=1 Tax=Kocuria rosea subsp. polaris TaxID=136273 RepID=A0A0W8I3T3_KOCRO|nr:NAD(P)-dependent oxidoreductase [Kocuria polaris]KUG52557.1 hydroxyacid dehydrogenase [Kocuria polaris]